MEQEKSPRDGPLSEVVHEIETHSPHLRSVDGPGKGTDEVEETGGVVKGDVPEAFVAELKGAEPEIVVGGSEEAFQEEDPMHDVKTEIESGTPKLRHVDSPDSPTAVGEGGVVKSDVPTAFEEELKNDHDITKGGKGEEGSTAERALDTTELKVVAPPRGTPHFRISAHHGMRPGGALGRDVKAEASSAKEAFEGAEAKPDEQEGVATKVFATRDIAGRGTPTFRISAHHGMRPGGALSRDLKADTSKNGEGSEEGSKSRGTGLPSRGGLTGSAPRRGGGLARQGSGVPGEQKAGGASLARTGSGVPKGGNDLNDFNSFLDAADVNKDQQ